MTSPRGSGPQLTELVRRLRARPVSSWRHGRREETARGALQGLADLAADAEGRPRRPVPDVGVAAIADQLAVLVRDAVAAGVPDAVLEPILEDFAERLALRRR